MDLLQALPDRPIYYAHLGCHPHSREVLDAYRRQFDFWPETADQALKEDPTDPVSLATERLLTQDPRLSDFQFMDEAEQGRERYFTRNSLAGFFGYPREHSAVQAE